MKKFMKSLFDYSKKPEFAFKDLEDQRSFERWAFGHTPVKYGVANMHSWNSRHGDIYFIKSDEIIGESIKKMYKIYMDHQ